jgi:hypothetical protein|nr:MAG TPA: 54S ribosomal protein [Caudoviricetes sp.]
MIKIQNDCVGCPIYCADCGAKHTPHFYCDECGREVDKEFENTEFGELCEECLEKYLEEEEEEEK